MKARQDSAADMAIITKLIQSPKSHENILTTKASLERGGTYSLFFDLAEKGDLWQYFINKEIIIDGVGQKATIFGRTIGLAGALVFLHEELHLNPTNEQPKSEQLQCYHLDLKPQNILVFEGTGGNDIWKISDFGISKIKILPHGQIFLDKVFKPKKHMDPSSGVENARFGGTYAAPEARELSDRVTRKSDVWSLGCVLALVLTFLDSQSSGIHEFQEARQENRTHDWFFDSEALKTRSDDKKILHSSVSDWLNALTKKASNRGEAEGLAIQKASEMLQDKLLIRDQDQRLSAKQVLRELRSIQSCFTESALSGQTSDAPSQSRHERRIWHPPLPFHNKQNSKHTAGSWYNWGFGLRGAVERSKFSTDGNHLAIVNNETIVVKSTADITQDRWKITRESEKSWAIVVKSTADIKHDRWRITRESEKSWADFSLGLKSLCVVVDSDYFEVIIESSKMPMQSMLTECSAGFTPSLLGKT